MSAVMDNPGVATGPAAATPAGPLGLTPTDLAGLLASFNEVTARLQATHEQLRGEVARLSTELRDANEQVQRSRRLAALGEMAAGIAHEVRNPLGSIRLYARMLEEDLAGQQAQAGLAVKITSATRVVEGIVGDVLSFAREFKVRREEVSARELLASALESCRHDGVPGWRTVDVVWGDLDSGEDVEGDSALLRQALVNLIRNAFEAMADEPARTGPRLLWLGCERRRMALSEGGGGGGSITRREECSVLTVRDTGPGVTPEVVARMFNPFFTTRGAGTGLGLAIVHRIVDAHGGRVVVRNNADVPGAPKGFSRGACVEVVIPLRGSGEGSQAGNRLGAEERTTQEVHVFQPQTDCAGRAHAMEAKA